MVLEHVTQRAGGVVVTGAALEGQGFLPNDVYPLDVSGVPDWFEDAIGEAQPKQIQDALHGQEVVDAEDGILG